MAKSKTKPAGPAARIEDVRAAAPELRRPASPAEVVARSSAAPWWVGFSFMAALALVLLWLPLSRIPAHYEINYNEGWNAYWQQAASDGARIYGKPPSHAYANYPPLSFHIVGLVGKAANSMTGAGRWVSLLSYLALGILTALTVHRLTGSRRCAAFSALSIMIFIADLKADRVGMNDPHLLGMAFIAFGFYAYVRDPTSLRWLRLAALAFVFGLWIKQSLLAFPCAVAIDLLLTSRKRFFTWLATGAAAAVVLLALTFALDGSHFLEHLALPRTYTYAAFLSNTVWYLLFFQAAIVACIVWCFRNSLSSGTVLLVWAFALANLMAFFFAGGGGADLNHMFDPLVAVALIGGVALPYAVRASEQVRLGSALLATLLIVPFFLGVLTMLPPHIQEDLAAHAAIPQLERDFAGAVQFVRSQPGPALCENLLLCYEAGKPFEYDPFAVQQELETGKLQEGAVLVLLDQHHFSAIQLDIAGNEPISATPRQRFPGRFMERLLSNYRPAARTGSQVIFTPN